MAIVLGGNCLVGIVRVGIVRLGIVRVGIVRVGIVRVRIFLEPKYAISSHCDEIILNTERQEAFLK